MLCLCKLAPSRVLDPNSGGFLVLRALPPPQLRNLAPVLPPASSRLDSGGRLPLPILLLLTMARLLLSRLSRLSSTCDGLQLCCSGCLFFVLLSKLGLTL